MNIKKLLSLAAASAIVAVASIMLSVGTRPTPVEAVTVPHWKWVVLSTQGILAINIQTQALCYQAISRFPQCRFPYGGCSCAYYP